MLELGFTVGLPLSGKSTILDKMMWPQKVCPDDIRLALGHEFYGPIEPHVWGMVDVIVRSHLIRRQNVIVDATNMTKYERKKWVKLAEEFDYKPVAWVAYVSEDTCIERANKDGRPHMIKVIRRMQEKYQEPQIDEGFSIRRLTLHVE